MANQETNGYFEKQRDLLLQEISGAMDSVIYNLDILNRSLGNSIQVGKEFDDVGRLWSHFYDGVNQHKRRQGGQKGEDDEEESLSKSRSKAQTDIINSDSDTNA